MADFLPAFETMLRNEGGYKLHTVKGDRGGMTYAGIARKMNPNGPGWNYLDAGRGPGAEGGRLFYMESYWFPIQGNEITHQAVAQTLFDFAVNAGTKTAIKLAQVVVCTTPDGSLGNKTLAALNAYDPEKFLLAYTLAKIARYRDIVRRDRTQIKFLLGWLNRALEGVA